MKNLYTCITIIYFLFYLHLNFTFYTIFYTLYNIYLTSHTLLKVVSDDAKLYLVCVHSTYMYRKLLQGTNIVYPTPFHTVFTNIFH